MLAIPLPFNPVAVEIGPLVLTWHGIFSAIGILAGLWFAAWLAPLAGLTEDHIWSASWWVIIGGLVGARLLFAAEHLPYFVENPVRVLFVHEGGISVFGAVLGGMAGGAMWARRAGVSAARLLDVVAPGFLLGQAIGRIGDIINGEHLGRHAPGLPWAVIYTHPNTLGEIGVPVHPAVAYELLWDLVAAAVAVWLLRRHVLSPGGAFAVSLALYGLGRFWVGFYRIDLQVAFGLGLAQLLGLAVLPAALVGLWLTWKRSAPHRTSASHAA
jgi:phosphatidylglycerol---prolipoprotein diacylglyceryl transferase